MDSFSNLIKGEIINKPDQVNNLLEKCNLDFLPQHLHSRKICLNEVMSKELESRKNIKGTDFCIKEFCQLCCSINYGNNDCIIYTYMIVYVKIFFLYFD